MTTVMTKLGVTAGSDALWCAHRGVYNRVVGPHGGPSLQAPG